jgi:hypothetical protein
MTEAERNADKAMLFDDIMNRPCYISFYTGLDGQGAVLKQTLRIKGQHYDKAVERKAERIARRLGASSWFVFKPIGIPGNVYYSDEDERLEGCER